MTSHIMMERSCCLVVKLARKAIAVARKEEQRLLLVEEQRNISGNMFKEKTSDLRQRLGELKSATHFMQPYDPRKKYIYNFVKKLTLELKAASKKALVAGHRKIYKSWTANRRSLIEVLEDITGTLKRNEVHMRNCTDKHPSCYVMFNILFNEILRTTEWLKCGPAILRQVFTYQKLIVLYDQCKKHFDDFNVEFSRYPVPQHFMTTRATPRPVDEASPLSSFSHVVNLLNGDLIGKPTGERLCWKYTFDSKPESNEAPPSVIEGQEQPVFMQLGKIDHVSQRPRPTCNEAHPSVSEGEKQPVFIKLGKIDHIYRSPRPTCNEAQPSVIEGQKQPVFIKLGKIDHVYQRPRPTCNEAHPSVSEGEKQPVFIKLGKIDNIYRSPRPTCNEAQPSPNEGQKQPVFIKLGKIDHIYQRPRPTCNEAQPSPNEGQKQPVIIKLGKIDHVYQRPRPTCNEAQPSPNEGQKQPVIIKLGKIDHVYQRPRPTCNEAQPSPNEGEKQPVIIKLGKIDHVYQRPRPMSEGYQQAGHSSQEPKQRGGHIGKGHTYNWQHMQLVQQLRQIAQRNQQTVQKKEQLLQQPVQSVQTGQQSSDIGQVYQQGGLVGKQLQNRRSARRSLTFPQLSPESATKRILGPRVPQSGTGLLPKRYSLAASPVVTAPVQAGVTLSSGIHPTTSGAKTVPPVFLRKGPEKTFEIFPGRSPPGNKSTMELKKGPEKTFEIFPGRSPPGNKSTMELKKGPDKTFEILQPIKMPTLKFSNMKPLN